MAENGVLKIGKVSDFQAHQIQHQLGAYTDCNRAVADSTNITAGCCKNFSIPVKYRNFAGTCSDINPQ